MSKATSQSKLARARVDALVRSGFVALRHDSRARRAYEALLVGVRERSNLLRPVARGPGIDLAVRALVNLARHHDQLWRSASTWSGGDGTVHALVRSLASHVVGGWPAPAVLAPVWLLGADSRARQQQQWFIEHVRGRPFRALRTMPLSLTRRMERIFLGSPADLSIPAALRRAELFALGAEPALVKAVLGTRLGVDLGHGMAWRPVLHWLVLHWDVLDAEAVPELVSFFHETFARGPFSITGRAPRSLARLVARWRGDPDPRAHARVEWRGSGLGRWSCTPWASAAQTDARWTMVELRDSIALHHEGRTLRHCVATYAHACRSGRSWIWSLRWQTSHGIPEPRFTIEVDPRRSAVVQIRGLANQRVAGEPAEIIRRWARQHDLRVEPWA